MKSAEVIIVGGGMVGLSTAYQLAKKGIKTILCQAGELGGGTSSANAGRAQVSEGYLDPLNLEIIRAGINRLNTLEEELGLNFEWHHLGYLCLIGSEHLWKTWQNRAQILSVNGIPTELLEQSLLQKVEPNLNTSQFLGAAYSQEGLLNPLLLCWAYTLAARRLGADLISHAPVTQFEINHQKVVRLEAGKDWYSAEKVVLMCGAWMGEVLSKLSIHFPMHFTHAEAFITEPLPPTIHNTIGLADFYERIHGQERAVAVGVGPHLNGSLLVTEAVTKTSAIYRGNTAWGLSHLSKDLLTLLPVLRDAYIIRAWGSPTPYTDDEQPVIGWMPQFDNVFVGAGFLQTITALPVVSEWMARMIIGDSIPVDLGPFSPERFYQV